MSKSTPKQLLLTGCLASALTVSLSVAAQAQQVIPPTATKLAAASLPAPVPASFHTPASNVSSSSNTTTVASATAAGALPAATASGAGELASDEVVYEQDDDSKLVAQAATNAAEGANQTDLAPVKLPERTSAFSNFDSYKTSMLYKLPGRLFINHTTENSIRLETNVFQTYRHNRSDLVYRCLPNTTIGWALTKRTRASFNYFYIRDQYAHNNAALSRNIHSLGVRLDQDFPITPKTTVTGSFMMRELLLTKAQSLCDLLPSVTAVRRVGERGIVYGSVLGQIRFRSVFGDFQEGDQFYALGGIYRSPRWTFLADHTFITNFGKRRLRFGPNNAIWVLTYEAAYKISKRLPIAAFVRAEPIFNMGANQALGFAGVNVRIYGGLRLEVNKPPIFPVKLAAK